MEIRYSLLIVLLSWIGWCQADLCYEDPSTGSQFNCDNQCCGSYPQVYCCDKDSFVAQCAAMGAIGCFFILVFVSCVIWKKTHKKKKISPLDDFKKKKPLPADEAPSVSLTDGEELQLNAAKLTGATASTSHYDPPTSNRSQKNPPPSNSSQKNPPTSNRSQKDPPKSNKTIISPKRTATVTPQDSPSHHPVPPTSHRSQEDPPSEPPPDYLKAMQLPSQPMYEDSNYPPPATPVQPTPTTSPVPAR